MTWPGEKAPQGAVLAWQAEHDMTCWREHPSCALQRARDLHLSRREFHAGQAAWFGEVLSRHLQRLPAREDVPDALAAARRVLEAAHAEVPTNRKRPASRRKPSPAVGACSRCGSEAAPHVPLDLDLPADAPAAALCDPCSVALSI